MAATGTGTLLARATGWGLWVAALGVTVLLRPLAGATEVGSTPTTTRSSSVAGLRTGTP